MGGPVLCSSLQDTPQDVDDNVAGEQPHYAGESWAEGGGHRRTQSWEQRQTEGMLAELLH